MHFELRYTVRDQSMGPQVQAEIEFHYGGRNPITVHFHEPADGQKGAARRTVACDACCFKKTNARVKAVFEGLALGKVMPSGAFKAIPQRVDKDGTIHGKYVPPLRIMPPAFQDFANSLESW